MKTFASRRRIQGLSLVEVMVSVVIGLFVVGAVLVSYLSSGKTGKQQAAYADMNENAQMALTLLSRDLLLAGYSQPTGAPPLAPPATVSTFSRTYSGRAVFGCDGDFDVPNKKASAGDVACANPVVGHPSLEIAYEADLTNTTPVDANNTPTNLADDIPSDCKGAQIRPAEGQVSGLDFFVTRNRYYLGTGSSGKSELYCASATQSALAAAVPAEPLVENVEDMKFWYGEANAANSREIVRYVAASDVADWGLVLSVRVCVLVRSDEAVLDMELYPDPLNPPKYLDCNSTEQTITDRFLRRAYFSTTTLRNKMAL